MEEIADIGGGMVVSDNRISVLGHLKGVEVNFQFPPWPWCRYDCSLE